MKMYRIILLLVAVLGLSACATGPTTIDGRNAPLTEIPDGQGVAMAKMIAIARPSAFNAKWRSLVLEDSAGKVFSLNDVGPLSAKYSMFMGTLPEGRYKIKQLVSAGSGPSLLFVLMSTDSAQIESRLPQFDVRKGAVTNLGTVVIQLPKGGDAASLQYVINDGDVGRQAALDDLYPEDRKIIKSMPATSPSDRPASDRIGETEALISKSPPFLTSLIRLSDGRMAAAGIAGFLHIRERDGTWRAVHMNSFDTFSALKELPDKTLAVGTENGKYFLMSLDGRIVERHRLSDPDLSIEAIIPMGRFGYAIQAWRQQVGGPFGPYSYLVLKKDDLHVDGTEKEILSFDGYPAFGTVPLCFHKSDLMLFFNEPGVRRTTVMSRLNMETGEKSQQGLPFWAIKAEPGPGGDLVVTRMNGLSFYRSVSKDDGKTWQAIEDEIDMETFFYTGELAYGLRKVATGWDTIDMTLTKTDDGGKSWKELGAPFTVLGVPRLLGLGGNEIVAYTGRDVRSTIDDGLTWRVEWPRQ